MNIGIPSWARLPITVVAIATCLSATAVFAADSTGNADNSTSNGTGTVHPVAEGKHAAKEIGHGVKKTTKVIGHAARDGTRAVGHKTREVTREVGHAFRDGAHELTEKKD